MGLVEKRGKKRVRKTLATAFSHKKRPEPLVYRAQKGGQQEPSRAEVSQLSSIIRK